MIEATPNLSNIDIQKAIDLLNNPTYSVVLVCNKAETQYEPYRHQLGQDTATLHHNRQNATNAARI